MLAGDKGQDARLSAWLRWGVQEDSWHCPQKEGQEPGLETKAPQEPHLVLCPLLAALLCGRCSESLYASCSPSRVLSSRGGDGSCCPLSIGPGSPGMLGAAQSPHPPDPACGVRCWSLSWGRFTSSKGILPWSPWEKAGNCPQLPLPIPQNIRWGQAASRSGRCQAAWEGNVK